ncbi:unnamed protein product [Fraxinus pennsylvanica]|uniref:BPL/LPL catalytic domain-containing protein n=1 Tax=Fraxinus pennsylvanica TaxID=56036 RepID=A0AAD2E7N4_9LAMI|nr:unnamed protein product [Fraxinus pennsylvanica]
MEDKLAAVGNRLLQPLDSLDELLPLLDVVVVVTLHFWLCDGGEVWCVGCGGGGSGSGSGSGGVLDVEVEVEVEVMVVELVPYVEAWSWQKAIVKARKIVSTKEEYFSDTLIILQHQTVYTLGTGNSEEFLNFDIKNAPFDSHLTERGGEVTFHVPGQLVFLYFGTDMLSISNITRWIFIGTSGHLKMVIRVLSATAIDASRVDGETGVWVDSSMRDRQVGSIKGLLRETVSSNGNRAANIDHTDDCKLIDAAYKSLIRPVYTLGTDSSEEFLNFDIKNAPFDSHRTERGGEVTFHVPGQLVMYPIINLKYHKMDLHWYLRALERLCSFSRRFVNFLLSLMFSLELIWDLNTFRRQEISSLWYKSITMGNISWIGTECHHRYCTLSSDSSMRDPGSSSWKNKGLLRETLSSNGHRAANIDHADDSKLIDTAYKSLIREFCDVFQLDLQPKFVPSRWNTF